MNEAPNETSKSKPARIVDAVLGRRQGSHAAQAERLPFVAKPAEADLDPDSGTITYAGETYVREAQLDDVYRERAHLVALLAGILPSHMGYTDPGAPDWPVVIIEGPYGQLSWHVSPRDIDLFANVRATNENDRPWDGHTTGEKYGRVREMIANLTGTPPAPTGDRLAAEVVVDVCGLDGDGDLDELKRRIGEVAAAWRPTISVNIRRY